MRPELVNFYPVNFLVKTRKSALALFLAVIALGAAGKPSAPVGLLVNGVNQPLAIDRDATRFTWMSEDAGRGARQTAYQILVATSSDRLAEGAVDFWDSGKVDSDRSASVEYAGKTLPSDKRFWWKVRVWDQTGQPGSYS